MYKSWDIGRGACVPSSLEPSSACSPGGAESWFTLTGFHWRGHVGAQAVQKKCQIRIRRAFYFFGCCFFLRCGGEESERLRSSFVSSLKADGMSGGIWQPRFVSHLVVTVDGVGTVTQRLDLKHACPPLNLSIHVCSYLSTHPSPNPCIYQYTNLSSLHLGVELHNATNLNTVFDKNPTRVVRICLNSYVAP